MSTAGAGALPTGFFDGPSQPLQTRHAAVPAAPAAPSASALPEGFFDDRLEDAKARNVDLEAQKLENERATWQAFSSFSATVAAQQADEERSLDELLEDKEQREVLQQKLLRARVEMLREVATRSRQHKRATPQRGAGAGAPESLPQGAVSLLGGMFGEGLMSEFGDGDAPARVNLTETLAADIDLTAEEAAALAELEALAGSLEPEAGQASSVGTAAAEAGAATASATAQPAPNADDDVDVADDTPVDTVAGLSALLRKRRRTRQRKVAALEEEAFTPLDPLDWRAKGPL